jgi:hypothetical protein
MGPADGCGTPPIGEIEGTVRVFTTPAKSDFIFGDKRAAHRFLLALRPKSH